MKKFKFAMIVVVAMVVVNAEATIIDFEDLEEFYVESPYTYLGISSYSKESYTLTTTADFGIAQIYEPYHIVMSSGPEMGTIEITEDYGGTFDLISSDFSSGLGQTITLIGTKFNGLTVEKAIVFDEPTGFSTYLFNDFTDLVSVSWNNDPYFAFDNIIIVPEPATLLLFTLGAFGVRGLNV